MVKSHASRKEVKMLKSITNILKAIPVRSFVTTFPTRSSQEVDIKIRATQLGYSKTSAMSREEFAKKYCSSFEVFVSNNDALIQKIGLSSQEAFKKMVNRSYENYLRHQNIVEPGRIF